MRHESMMGDIFHRWQPEDKARTTDWLLLALVVAIGASLRLWGLGNLGLHGDEDVMALAVHGLRETGSPILPSGMYYVRALPQLYLMTASTYVFGDTEWALRLPSVLIGALGILIGYWLGRRFLSVRWAIVFAAAVALLPSLISLSQTARMYGFYVTLVMLFAVAMFRWERSESILAYFIAVVACLISLSFHALAVFSTLLFFYPGLLKGSWRLLGLGAVAFIVCVLFQQEHSSWVGSHYFPLVEVTADEGETVQRGLARRVSVIAAAIGVLIAGAGGAGAFVISRVRGFSQERAILLALAVVCLMSAVVLGFLVQYHMAGLAFAVGTILFARAGLRVILPLVLGVLLLVLFALHAYVAWHSPNVATLNDLLERMAGTPYPKPYLTFSSFSPFGIAAYGIVVIYFAALFARGRALPDHVLFFLLSVFAPLFLMGFLSGQYAPPRYVIGFLPFFVLAAIAGILDLIDRHGSMFGAKRPMVQIATGTILLAIFVNPKDLWYNVNPRSSDFPFLTDHRGVDHKGAAEYVLGQRLSPDDVVISVDTQQQVYYLEERVDYYMRSLKADSRNSSFMRDERVFCLYTGRPQITTGEELANLFRKPRRRNILIIGSGEISPDRVLADGLWQTMKDFGVEEVYRGRDGATQVWRYTAGADSLD